MHCRSRAAVHRYSYLGCRKRSGSPRRHNSRLIKFLSVSLDDSQSTLGTLTDTSAETVAERVLYEPCLASDQRERALVACCNALAAAVAVLLINLDNVSSHPPSLPVSLSIITAILLVVTSVNDDLGHGQGKRNRQHSEALTVKRFRQNQPQQGRIVSP